MISLPASPLIKTVPLTKWWTETTMHSSASCSSFQSHSWQPSRPAWPNTGWFSLSKANLTVFLPPVHDPRVHKANIYHLSIHLYHLPIHWCTANDYLDTYHLSIIYYLASVNHRSSSIYHVSSINHQSIINHVPAYITSLHYLFTHHLPPTYHLPTTYKSSIYCLPIIYKWNYYPSVIHLPTIYQFISLIYYPSIIYS